MLSNFSLSFVEEYIDVSRRCTQPIELRDALMTHVSTLGFDNMSAIALLDGPSIFKVKEGGKDGPVRIGTYSEKWAKRFFEKSYDDVDPVCLKMKTAVSPYYWKDCNAEHEKTVGWSRLGKQFQSESKEQDLVCGLTIPIDNVDAKSSISFCGRQAMDGPGVRHMLHLVGIYFQQRILALSEALSTNQPKKNVRLTPREAEVLHWYANGKSAWDIGVMLDVSEAAVRFHLSNVRGKYGVASSVHATALAISRNDIRI